MKKILNYVTNGKGTGLKYFVLFWILICVLCYFIFSSVLIKNVQNNKQLSQFFNKIPTLEISDGRLIEPKNTYVSIPIVEGYSDELIINTVPEIPVNLNFASGVYLSQDAVYLKVPAAMEETQVIKWSDVGNRIIDRTALEQGLQSVVNVFSILFTIIFGGILWIGYLFVQITVKLFFWIVGYKTVKWQICRAVTLSWIGMLSVNFSLLYFSLQLSIPVLFVLVVVLSLFLVFMAPKQEQEQEQVKGHNFFDTVPPTQKDIEIASQTEEGPVKVSMKKKNLKLVEKPRRQPTKKNVQK